MEKDTIIYSHIAQTQYNILNEFLSGLLKGFKKRNYQFVSLQDFTNNKWDPNRIAFFLNMNAAAMDYPEMMKCFEDADILIFSYCIDRPESLYKRLLDANSNHIFSFIDKECVAHFMRNAHFNNRSCFIAHGGSEAERYRDDIRFEDRDIDILFMGSIDSADSAKDEFIQVFGDEEEGFYDTVVNLLKSNYQMSLHDVLDPLMTKKNNIPRKTEIYTEVSVKYYYIYNSYRYAHRRETLKALLDMGFQVTAYMNKRNEEFEQYPNFHFKGTCDYQESLNLMTRSKITVNNMPLFKQGAHERIFNAMLNGSVSFSNGTTAFPNDLVDKESILFYDLNNLNEMEEKVNSVLNHPENFYKITKKAREVALNGHTWSHRADEIIDAIRFYNAL